MLFLSAGCWVILGDLVILGLVRLGELTCPLELVGVLVCWLLQWISTSRFFFSFPFISKCISVIAYCEVILKYSQEIPLQVVSEHVSPREDYPNQHE